MKAKPLSASQAALASLNIAKPAVPTPPPRSTCHKLSVSLFDADVEGLDRIIDRLWQECSVRASRSDAVKVAVRFAVSGVMDSEALRMAYRAAKAEDRRK